MPKPLSIAAVAALALTLGACGSSSNSSTDSVKSDLSQQGSSISSAISSTLSKKLDATNGAKKNADGSYSKPCTVTGVPNVSPDKVEVVVNVKGNAAAVASFIACPSASAVVNVVAGLKAEKPIKTGPFTCTPAVTKNKAAFTCAFTGTSAVTATYKFTLNYKS